MDARPNRLSAATPMMISEGRQEDVTGELEDVLTGLAAGVERLDAEPLLELDGEDVLEHERQHERGKANPMKLSR
jgi:hypothetical protein